MDLPQTPPIAVIGMHRSGTSLVAEILGDLGVHLGRQLDVHSEPELFKDINRELLALAGGHWARPSPFLARLGDLPFERRAAALARQRLLAGFVRYGPVDGDAWAFKDPRTTLTLPIWRQLYPEVRVLHVVRHGFDVALSLQRREVRRWLRPSSERRLFPPSLGACYRLWTVYAEVGRRQVGGAGQGLTLRYEDLVEQPVRELAKVAEWAGLTVEEEQRQRVAAARVRRGARRGALDRARIAASRRLGRLDLRPLRELGYEELRETAG